MNEELTQLGLNHNESLVYLYLLKSKEKTATQIAKDTKLNRSVVYSTLDSLIDKGLASYILIKDKRHFSAASPETLNDFLEDKKRILSDILPLLKSIKIEEKASVNVEVFQGIKGGISVLKDIIREGKDYVAFGDEGRFQEISKTQLEQYVRQLNEKKIKERIITRKGVKLFGSSKNTQIRYLPKEFRFPTITTIYGDKVAIAIFEEPYYTILIKSKPLAYTYRKFFDGLWRIAKP